MAVAKTNATDFLAESELTLSQLKVLFALGSSDGPMSVNELADRIHLSLAATGRIIDKLVGVTLVNRREDTVDRRVKRISLTDSGQEFIDSERAVMDDTITRFVSTLPADIGEQLRAALDRIVRADTDYFAACSHSPRTAAHPV
ncbi:MarR family transcriptional regulator [Gordonia pseudamarae]|jgi:DNA-binding MarR family transcriptional regulator|uniref:MarR family transcriptional regulator n=2 Tax=Gordoniaceae TaxID=85026 RepID=A0ABX6IPM6_9ACTN|nr:MarR family transcriptional regulator [Gordonia sp. (in: high G+C Gram-positive bacteria)]MBD0021818.1 MarR family transcriptional regulator [Gordonia sp. (in: high G+C Gram-positive bacteria)]QHN28839.1 MarR family transcriptional regulator [Gordonia pseudamarae]QHN37712.1 MarR family transcriptional regulator [Gordonia pseudamarae]